MEKYNYLSGVKEDVKNYINYNHITINEDNREEVEQELNDNPRSRSATLRCVEKLHDRYI